MLRAKLRTVEAKLKATEAAFSQMIASQFTIPQSPNWALLAATGLRWGEGTFCGSAHSEWLRLCHDFGDPATIRSAIEDRSAVLEERERCAKVVETYANSEHAVDRIIAEIREPKGAR